MEGVALGFVRTPIDRRLWYHTMRDILGLETRRDRRNRHSYAASLYLGQRYRRLSRRSSLQLADARHRHGQISAEQRDVLGEIEVAIDNWLLQHADQS